MSAMDIEFERIDINPCPISDGNPEPNYFAGTARCKPSTMVSSTGHVVKLKNPDGSVVLTRKITLYEINYIRGLLHVIITKVDPFVLVAFYDFGSYMYYPQCNYSNRFHLWYP